MTEWHFEIDHESDFKMFCRSKWYEHKDEILTWTGRPLTDYNDSDYFRKNRWLLKRMYKEQNNA